MNAWSIALDSIWHHKLRSALTALGIVIGVFAVVTLTSLGAAVKSYVARQFSVFGADLITVAPASPHAASEHGHGFAGGFGLAPSTLTAGDAAAIARLTGDHVAAAAPVAMAPGTVARDGTAVPGASIVGTTPAYFGIENLPFTSGVAFGASGAVLGHAVAAALFGSAPSVGASIDVGGRTYVVSGVLKASDSQLSGNANGTVYIPVADALGLAGSTHVSEIVVAADGSADVPAASNAIQRLLQKRHGVDDFSVVTAGEILSTVNSTLTVITSVLGGIAAISLVVGGIGIMNIMLVTVTERVREIGTRKALGAHDGDILIQFLVESVLLALLGGAIGLVLSALAGRVVGQAVHFSIALTSSSIILALLFSVGVGAVFGVLPAMNAARLMPAEALRSE